MKYFLALIFVCGFLAAIPSHANASSQPLCPGNLSYRRDYWQNAQAQTLPGGDTLPQVQMSQNTYYWFCNPITSSIPNKVWPDAVGYCMTRLNSAHLASGTDIQNVSFNPYYKELSGNRSINPGKYFLHPPDNGNKGDEYCTGRQGIPTVIQEWLPMDEDPGLVLSCNIALSFHPDLNCNFVNPTGGTFHPFSPGNDPIVDPTP